MFKTALYLTVALALILSSCSLFKTQTDVIELLNNCSQQEYNNLSVKQKVWLKYYCDTNRNRIGTPKEQHAVKRGLLLYRSYMLNNKENEKMKEKFKSNYEYLNSFPAGIPYPEE